MNQTDKPKKRLPKTWYLRLPNKLRERLQEAIELPSNANEVFWRVRCRAQDSILYGFSWSSTKEKDKFWLAIHKVISHNMTDDGYISQRIAIELEQLCDEQEETEIG